MNTDYKTQYKNCDMCGDRELAHQMFTKRSAVFADMDVCLDCSGLLKASK